MLHPSSAWASGCQDKRPLVYSSMEQLNKQIGDMESKAQGKQPRMLAQTANEAVKQAKENEIIGADETAYLLYMRYTALRKFITSQGEYARERVYYDSILPPEDANKAIGSCERIAKSLERRYRKRQSVTSTSTKDHTDRGADQQRPPSVNTGWE